jgi:YaiO family outer membrane protein
VTAQTAPTAPGETPSVTAPDRKNKPSTQTPQIDPELIVDAGASYEHLSNGAPDWQSYYLLANRKFASGQVLYGSASLVRRFDLTDPSLMMAFVQPLGESRRWIATVEAAGSPTHDVLAEFSIYGQLDHVFGAGWVGHAGFRYGIYSEDTVDMAIFGVEKYYKQYRFAYTLYVAQLDGNATAASHAFQANYYYGERNSVGLSAAFGEEIESVGNGRFIRTPVREVGLNGRHWFTRKWGLSYWGGWHRQGTFYTRSGAQIGLLLRF